MSFEKQRTLMKEHSLSLSLNIALQYEWFTQAQRIKLLESTKRLSDRFIPITPPLLVIGKIVNFQVTIGASKVLALNYSSSFAVFLQVL